jgi:hypothetical protein
MNNNLKFITGLTPTKLSVNTAAQMNASQVLDTTDLPTTRTEAWK